MGYHVVGPLKLADAVAAAGAVASVDFSVDSIHLYSFVSSGTYVATVALEGSVENGSVTDANSKWETIGTISPSGTFLHLLDKAFAKIRANVTAYTSGTITVWMKAV